MLFRSPAFSERNFGCAQFKGFLDKAVKAGAVKLGQRDVSSGEFSVFLPGDFDDDVPAKTATTPVETAPRERGRGRGRREAAPPAKIEPLVTEEITPHSEAAAPEDIRGATPGALLDRGLRRGRLKFSGKSGRAATVTEPAAETSPATEPVEEPVVEETAPVVIGMETSTEEAMKIGRAHV